VLFSLSMYRPFAVILCDIVIFPVVVSIANSLLCYLLLVDSRLYCNLIAVHSVAVCPVCILTIIVYMLIVISDLSRSVSAEYC